MTKKTRNNKKARSNKEAPTTTKTKAPSSKSNNSNNNKFQLPILAAVAASLAYLLGGGDSTNNAINYWETPAAFHKKSEFQKSNASTPEQRLMEEWPTGGLVSILKDDDDDHVGRLHATKNIGKGQMFAAVQYEDLAKSVAQAHPGLKELVQKSLAQQVQTTKLTFSSILSVIALLLEKEQGDASPWASFIDSLPRNVSTMSWYWTPEERQCVVSRPNGDALRQELQVFHAVLDDIQPQFAPLSNMDHLRQTSEWAFVNLKTRGFGHFFLPVLHTATHNPLQSVPVFLSPSAAYFVATQDMAAGDPVYTSFGTLSPVVLAERFGTLGDSQIASVYFELPSMLEDFRTHPKTQHEPLCTQDPAMFFGNLTREQTVAATFGEKQSHSTCFKPYMPDERTYACIRVLLQTERDTDVAYYVAEKLKTDLTRYEEMAAAHECQSKDGNFPLIRQANELTAQLMRGALKVAQLGADWKISYPGIDHYVRNGS